MKFPGKTLLLALIPLLLLAQAYAATEEMYSEAAPSDTAIYLYFSEFLEDGEHSLQEVLNEERQAVNSSRVLEERVELTREEARYYTGRGFKTNVSYVVSPFLSLSRSIGEIASAQRAFLGNGSGVERRTALIRMRMATQEANLSLNRIEAKVLWNGSEELRFNVSGLRGKLEEVRRLIGYYAERLPQERELVVAVSDTQPVLHENITIAVRSKNVSSLTLHIDGTAYNSTWMKYSFEEIGYHSIYATGVADGSRVRSNTVELNVKKVPTFIALSSKQAALVKEEVEVAGFLWDYFDSPLNATLSVHVGGETTTMESEGGRFNFNVTGSSGGSLNISARYRGNDTYRGANASTAIFFSRYPLSLSLEASSTQEEVNGTVNFTGRVHGARYPLVVYALKDSARVKALKTEGGFNFTLRFSSPGKHYVSAYYPGDPLHSPAESRMIEITVTSPREGGVLGIVSTPKEGGFRGIFNSPSYGGSKLYLPLIAAVALLLILSARFLRGREVRWPDLKWRRRESPQEEAPAPPPVEEESMEGEGEGETEESQRELPEDVGEAYTLLFDTLTRTYGLKRSLTPRELLASLEGEEFSEKLGEVTTTHERVIFGKGRLRDKDKYLSMIEEILEGLESTTPP